MAYLLFPLGQLGRLAHSRQGCCEATKEQNAVQTQEEQGRITAEVESALEAWQAEAAGFVGRRRYPRPYPPLEESLLEYACRRWPALACRMLDRELRARESAGTALSTLPFGGAELLMQALYGGRWPRGRESAPDRLRLVSRLLAAGAPAAEPSRPDFCGGRTPLVGCSRRPPEPLCCAATEGLNARLLALLLESPGLGPEKVGEARREAAPWAWPQLDQWLDQWLRWSPLRRAWVAAAARAPRR